MAREISRAESWERAHEIFSQINFNSFDFDTIKNSLLDYTKLYFPEDFNDYIESSEFIAVLELFAYASELMAYRIDLNAHENFITTAQRKESVLRLAKLLSYKASRNIPARGLTKLTSIQTTETVFDSQGRNLAGRKILWDDNNNPDWKEQFLLVMNRVLEQEFGTVAPNERVQVEDVLFEIYTWNNTSTGTDTAIKYSATITGGTSAPMELVPVELTNFGPTEKRPERNAKMSLLYGSDGLGDSSDTTGFFLYTKQGDLQFEEATFDGVTPNQIHEILIDDINDTDVWLNLVDSQTREIVIVDPFETILPHLVAEDLRYGEWVEVDIANAQNIIFNTNKNRHKYELETLDDDQIRIVFGDGEFSDIPGGSFDIWYRTSLNEDVVIPKASVIDNLGTLTYLDANSSVQTLTFTFSLISSLQNNSPSEDIEHIRRVAPSVYYTQDRMVNGRDYNTFPLQDPSILKMRTVNRTFAGDSKYIAWHDPKEYYEDVKIFGDDMALYWDEDAPLQGGLTVVNGNVSSQSLLTNFIEPLLCSTDFFAKIGPLLEEQGIPASDLRCTFNNTPYSFDINDNEILAIVSALDAAQTTTPIVQLYYSVLYDEWTVDEHPCQTPSGPSCGAGPADSIFMIQVEAQFAGSVVSGWDVRWRTRRLISQSTDIRFWFTNSNARIINFDTLNSNQDTIVVLAANTNADGTSVLGVNRNYDVISQELVEQNLPNAGLPDIHRLSILPVDVNDDGIPDNLDQPLLFNSTISRTYAQYLADGNAVLQVLTFPNGSSQIVSEIDSDITVSINGTILTEAAGDFSVVGSNILTTGIEILSPTFDPLTGTDVIDITFNDYVYFTRPDAISEWLPVITNNDIKTLWALDTGNIGDDQRYIRFEGRYPLNFAWFHSTPFLNLIDPAASNINDMFVITRGFYTSNIRWVENKTTVVPVPPTPRELRTSYADILQNKMISDTVIMQSGIFKLLFGPRAIPELQSKFSVIRPVSSSLTDNEVKVRIVNRVRDFFAIDDWEFGETFFATELFASIHADLGPEIDSIVIVPLFTQNQFGDLFQIPTRENEMFLPDINTTDIEIVQAYTSVNIRQNEN